MSMETLLRGEINDELVKLTEMEIGSEQYKTTVDGLTKLMDRAIEIDKHENELQEKIEAREAENEIKLKQLEDDVKDRFWKNILSAAGIVIPSGVTVWGILKSLNVEFKDERLITSMAGKDLMKKAISIFKK